MKPLFFCLLLFVLFAISASAQNEILFVKLEYAQGETAQAYIPYESIDIKQFSITDAQGQKQQIGIVLTQLTITEHNSYPYLAYFNIPLTLPNGTYFLNIEINKTASISKNFSISNLTFGPNIKPPLIDLNKETSRFEILFTNPSASEQLIINLASENENIKPIRTNLELQPKESKTLYVDFTPLYKSTSITAIYDNITYTIPIIALINATGQEAAEPAQIIPQEQEGELKFLTQKIEHKDSSNITTFEGSIKLQNTGQTALENVHLEFTGNLAEIAEMNAAILSFAPNEIKEIYIIINKNKNAGLKEYSGSLTASSGTIKAELPIRFIFVEEQKAREREETVQIPNTTIIGYSPDKQEDSNALFGLIISLLLVIIIIIILVKLRRKEARQFREYVEEVKRK